MPIRSLDPLAYADAFTALVLDLNKAGVLRWAVEDDVYVMARRAKKLAMMFRDLRPKVVPLGR